MPPYRQACVLLQASVCLCVLKVNWWWKHYHVRWTHVADSVHRRCGSSAADSFQSIRDTDRHPSVELQQEPWGYIPWGKTGGSLYYDMDLCNRVISV